MFVAFIILAEYEMIMKNVCYFQKYYNDFTGSVLPRQEKRSRQNSCRDGSLLLPEGHAVGALIHGGVCLVGAHLDAVQGTVVFGVAVISALADGTFDTLVGIVFHVDAPPFQWVHE